MVKVFVVNDDKLIYEVKFDRQLDSTDYCLAFNLTLVAGHDYINPDMSDDQGYVVADRFIADVQYTSISIYPLQESLGEVLLNEGYTLLEKLPTIHETKKDNE